MLAVLVTVPGPVSSELVTTSTCDTTLSGLWEGSRADCYDTKNQLCRWEVIGLGSTARRQCEWHLEYNELVDKLNSACTETNPCLIVPFTCTTLPASPPPLGIIFCADCNTDATCTCGGPGAIATWNGSSWECDGFGQSSTNEIVYQVCKLLDAPVAADDDIPYWAGTITGTRLVSAGCHCSGACTTPPTFSWADIAMNAISLSGGSDLSCQTSSSIMTFTSFDTSDTDRDLSPGELLRYTVTNTPSASLKVLLCARFTLQ